MAARHDDKNVMTLIQYWDAKLTFRVISRLLVKIENTREVVGKIDDKGTAGLK